MGLDSSWGVGETAVGEVRGGVGIGSGDRARFSVVWHLCQYLCHCLHSLHGHLWCIYWIHKHWVLSVEVTWRLQTAEDRSSQNVTMLLGEPKPGDLVRRAAFLSEVTTEAEILMCG